MAGLGGHVFAELRRREKDVDACAGMTPKQIQSHQKQRRFESPPVSSPGLSRRH
jgi:hypothetical protein